MGPDTFIAMNPINPPTGKYVLVNNLRLHYLEWGNENACPVILLHGITDSAHIWDYFASNSLEHFRLIALDQRGHGASDWSIPPAYSCSDYVSDLAEFIEALQLGGVVLIGHSMGALHANMYAFMQPDRVAGLVHVDIEPCPPPSNREYLRGLYDARPAIYNSVQEYVGHVKKRSPYAEEEILRYLSAFALTRKSDGKYYTIFDREVLKHFDQYDLRFDLPNIKCPTLIVRGKESQVMRADIAREMKHAIPRSKLVEISKATHRVLTDNPVEFQQVLLDFLKNLKKNSL